VLRLYTREQYTLEGALEHQIILVALKQALAVESDVWCDPSKVLHLCRAVLRTYETSEEDLGLRAWVHMRARQWLGPCFRIGSMVSDFENALLVRSRLLRAKATSWESLRAEWLQLVGTRRRKATQEAEVLIDRQRHHFLKGQLSRAVKGVEKLFQNRGSRPRSKSTRFRDLEQQADI